MDLNAIKQLHEGFAIPGVASVVAGGGGLAAVRITSPLASAEIYLQGAQVSSWLPAGADEVIFMSEQSRWGPGRAIRGGVPICFPWFGAKADDPKAPQHGFARTTEWQLESVVASGAEIVVTLALESSATTKALWPHDFRAAYRVTVGSELRLELNVSNTGETPFSFEEALHTYHAVSDVHLVRIAGLDGLRYLDKPDAFREKSREGEIVFSALTDRVYLEAAGDATILDGGRRIVVSKQNSKNTVVWNPWAEGAAALADMGDDEWRRFVCVEACNCLDAAIRLGPGAEHAMTATIRVG